VKIRRSLLKDTVSVAAYAGDGAYGPVYAAAVTIPCSRDRTRRLVRNADGDEVVSELRLYVHPQDESSFTPESLIDSASKVISVRPMSLRGSTAVVEVTCE